MPHSTFDVQNEYDRMLGSIREVLVARKTTGIVRWFDGSKGYGYIDAESGEDVFVHYTAITCDNIRLLAEGEQVSFFLEETSRGPVASDISRLN